MLFSSLELGLEPIAYILALILILMTALCLLFFAVETYAAATIIDISGKLKLENRDVKIAINPATSRLL